MHCDELTLSPRDTLNEEVDCGGMCAELVCIAPPVVLDKTFFIAVKEHYIIIIED